MQNKAELNELLEKRAVEYYFQPIVSTATGEIYAYEALMRAHMTTLQNPAEILQLARMESKLNQIESMTWFKSMEAFSGWIEKGRVSEACRIFINSVPNLVLPSDQLDQFEKRYQPYLKNIVLEITEEEEDVYKRQILSYAKEGVRLGSGRSARLTVNSDLSWLLK